MTDKQIELAKAVFGKYNIHASCGNIDDGIMIEAGTLKKQMFPEVINYNEFLGQRLKLIEWIANNLQHHVKASDVLNAIAEKDTDKLVSIAEELL